MKVSVIIPTKNRWLLLKETLNNILQQSLPPYEVIVVDDGSEDKTMENMVKEFKDKAICVLNKGKGPGAARNCGMEIATGEYVKFFDSDDLMSRNTLEAQVSILNDSNNAFVYSPYFYAYKVNLSWNVKENVILQYHPLNVHKPLNYYMCRGLFIPIPAMLFRRELLNEAGYWKPDVTAYEDWNYLWRISLIEPNPAHINECAFLYRIHGSQTTEGNFTNEQRDKDKVKVFEELLEDLFPSSLNRWDKQNLLMKIYPEIKRTGIEVNKPDSIFHFISKNVVRIQDKIGRLRTKTNWQPHHGPLVDSDIIERYLKNIE